MSNRKILVLLNDVAEAMSCTNFIVRLFKDSKTLVVIAFTEDSSVTAAHQQHLATVLQQNFRVYPNVNLMVRTAHKLSAEDIAREGKYTDLIVLPASMKGEMHWLSMLSDTDSRMFKHVPVMLVPETSQDIDEVVITYDGNNPNLSSVKQFCQIMDSLCSEVNVTLLEVNHDTSLFLPEEEKLLIEYLKGHCKNLGVYKASDESPEKILQQINCSPNAMVVSGTLASLHATLPQLQNLGSVLIEETKMPGFFGGSDY